MANLRDEHNLKSGGFEAIYDILTSLKDNESKVLETLFFYKINDMDEFNRESTQVVKDFKIGKMDPNALKTRMTVAKSVTSKKR